MISSDFQLSEIKVIDGPIKVESIKVLSGANYFSGEPVIRFRINLCDYAEVYTNQIDGFFERLKESVPSLIEHHCSPGRRGGFFERILEGTLLGHVMEHVAIELQTLAGMYVGFGKTRITKKEGVYNVVFRFFDEVAGIYAGKASVNLINSILINQKYEISDIIRNLIHIRESRMLGFSTQAIVNEAKKRKIPTLRLDKYNLVQIGTGKYRKIIRATITGKTSLIAVETTDNKFLTNSILNELGVPVPNRIISSDVNEILNFQTLISKPIVIKPVIGSKGNRVSIMLTNTDEITKAFDWAKEYDKDVIAQEFITGDSYRILVIDHKFEAAVKLEPPYIIGNGKNSVLELINELNSNPIREIGDKGKLSKIEIDDDTFKIMDIRGLTIDTILAVGEKLILKNSENPRLGGKSYDVTDKVHPYNKFVCERISKALFLDVAGIDLISEDISVAINMNNARIIEVNSAPDFKMHIMPTEGKSREVQKSFIDMLFPKRTKNHIPIIAITGTNNKSILANILKLAFKKRGKKIGMLTSDGLFIEDNCIAENNLNDVKNQQIILKDPTIDMAIMEIPVESILEYGLGYEYADYGIVLNIDEKEDYYKYDHIRDLEDIAYAKSVVAEQVYDNGYTIINADSDFAGLLFDRIYSNAVLFTQEAQNNLVVKHINKGGLAFIKENNKIFIIEKGIKKEVCSLNNEENEAIIAAVATLYCNKFSIEEISEILKSLI